MCSRFYMDEESLREIQRLLARLDGWLRPDPAAVSGSSGDSFRQNLSGGSCMMDRATDRATDRVTDQVTDRGLPQPGDIHPSEPALVLTGREQPLLAETMFWGFSRPGKHLRMINARVETVQEKPSFSASIQRRRCVIPAAGFYEWDREKTMHTFRNPGTPLLYLAGFYDLRENQEQFVILTTDANRSMRPVHDRMPLILREEQVESWIRDDRMTEEYLRQTPAELEDCCEYQQLSLF